MYDSKTSRTTPSSIHVHVHTLYILSMDDYAILVTLTPGRDSRSSVIVVVTSVSQIHSHDRQVPRSSPLQSSLLSPPILERERGGGGGGQNSHVEMYNAD